MKDFLNSVIIVFLETIVFLAIILGIIQLVGYIISWAEQHIILFLILTVPCLIKAISNEINRI